jgi:hypothetical protein
MATKSELISQSLIKLGGGIVTSDMSVRWGEAESYLAYCVNYVMSGTYWADSKNEGEKTINPMLLMRYPMQVLTDENRADQLYSLFPVRAISLSKGRSIEVRLINGRICIPVTVGNSGLQGYYARFKSEPSYEVESRIRINWHNIDPLIQQVIAGIVVHVEDLDDDDEVLLPSEADLQVVDMMVQFLSGEKQLPKDKVQDGADNMVSK